MTGHANRDVAARLTELEATVRGLTQELVSAEARIRQLEAALEDGDEHTDPQATKDTRPESQASDETASTAGDEERGSGLDDIIVA